jgi:hypothetical protein
MINLCVSTFMHMLGIDQIIIPLNLFFLSTELVRMLVIDIESEINVIRKKELKHYNDN